MFWVDVIFPIDRSIIVGIIIPESVFGNIVDIITIPSTWTISNVEWTFTIELWISFWASIKSPSVFNINDTLVKFTRINSTIIVEITLHVEFFKMRWINVIFWIDLTIKVGIIVVHVINGDIEDIITSPFTWATSSGNFKWTITPYLWISFWTSRSSPRVFVVDDTDVIFTDV